MEVAVVADLDGARSRAGSERSICAAIASRRSQQALRASRRRVRSGRVRRVPAGRTRALRAASRSSVQRAMSSRRDRLRREIRRCRRGWRGACISAVRRPIWRMRCRWRRSPTAFRRRRRSAEQALLVDEAVEIGAGDGPGVALVFDESMHDRERAAAARPRPVRRCRAASAHSGNARLSTRKRPISISGMDAGGDPAQHLHHVVVVDDHAWCSTARGRPR